MDDREKKNEDEIEVEHTDFNERANRRTNEQTKERRNKQTYTYILYYTGI